MTDTTTGDKSVEEREADVEQALRGVSSRLLKLVGSPDALLHPRERQAGQKQRADAGRSLEL